jgi:DeoR family glycerol-3-phosphate regulon repressor
MAVSKTRGPSADPACESDVLTSGNESTQPSALGQRQQEILDIVRGKGFESIENLARHFDVTPQTIRRDINSLSGIGLLRRHHGGAGLPSSVENYAYTARKILCLQEKKRIAHALARQIPNKSSLFINIGTTTEEVARELMEKERLRVITNNLNVASILSGNENLQIIVAGGMVRHSDGGIVGEAASDFMRQFKVDIGIIGISGVDMDGTLLDFDYREVRTARAIIENSRRVFLVTDHTKFGRSAMVRLGSIDEMSAVFTDQQPPQQLLDRIIRADVQLFVAQE